MEPNSLQVNKFRRVGMPHTPQTVVGVHIAYDKIVAAAREQSLSGATGASSWETGVGDVDVLVCSLGHKSLMKEKLSVLKELWKVGVSSTLMHDTNQVK